MLLLSDEDIETLDNSGLFRIEEFLPFNWKRRYTVIGLYKGMGILEFIIPSHKDKYNDGQPRWAHNRIYVDGEKAFNLLPKELQEKFIYYIDLFKYNVRT